MTPASTYTARCWREDDGWVVQVPELGRTAHADRLSQVEAVAQDLVARYGGEEATAARLVVDLDVHDDLRQLLDAATSARNEPDELSVSAQALRRGLARRLVDEGFPVQDVATLLGVSVPRAQELLTSSSRVAADHPADHPADRPADEPVARDAVPVRSGASHAAYQHEAFVYRGDADFLAGTVPFVLDAVSLGQPVLVAVTQSRLVKLRAAVGPTAKGVQYVDMRELGANPARIIPAWRSFVDTHSGPGRPVRGIGEPVWAGRRATELAECQLHEALLNLAVEPDMPLWLLCPYDADALSEPVLEEAARSHPSLREGEGYRGSTTYGGVHHVDRLFAGRLPDPPPGVPARSFARAELPDLRRQVRQQAAAAGLAAHRTSDLALAVTEVATNSVRHGGGRGVLRLWQQGDAIVCEITDRGRISDPLAGRRAPSMADESGRGLWLANQLCDLVQIRSGHSGTVVRLLSWL